MGRLFLIIFIAYLGASCSQRGCPGGMCPPDRYYAQSKKASKRGLKSVSHKSSKHKKISKSKKSQNNWSRNSGNQKISVKNNFESNKNTGQKDSKKYNSTSLEKNHFSHKKKANYRNFETDNNTGQKDSKNPSSFSHENNTFSGEKSGKIRNIESDKFSGKRDKKNPSYTLIEENPFSQKKAKTYNYSRLLGAKKIKNKSRKGHQEGLFSKRESRYQDTRSKFFKHQRKSTDKIGVKKLH